MRGWGLGTRLAFIDQGEFEATKTLDDRRALRCDKHQFRAKMTVSTQTVFEISLLNVSRNGMNIDNRPTEKGLETRQKNFNFRV